MLTTPTFTIGKQIHLGWAFVERQANLWKRHWAWEVVWLLYGVVNTLAITFIAGSVGSTGLHHSILVGIVSTLVGLWLTFALHRPEHDQATAQQRH